MGRQALKCSARRTNGKPCRAWAINGGTVCVAHGGAAKQVKAAAARNVAERQAEKFLATIGEFEPVTDPLNQLQLLAGRAVKWMQVLEGIVADLHRIRYQTESEQLDARIVLYERAMDRCSKVLVEMSRLDIAERQLKIDQALGKLIIAAVAGALADVGADPELQQAIRPALARRIDLAAAGGQLAIAPAAVTLPAGGAS